MQEAVPRGMKKSSFSKGFIPCPSRSARVSKWGTRAHVHRDGGVVWGAAVCCKSSGRVREPLYETSRGLDARQSMRSARPSSVKWCTSWAVRSNPFDAGMRLPGSEGSLLC